MTSGNQLVECQECHSLYHQVRVGVSITKDIDEGVKIMKYVGEGE